MIRPRVEGMRLQKGGWGYVVDMGGVVFPSGSRAYPWASAVSAAFQMAGMANMIQEVMDGIDRLRRQA